MLLDADTIEKLGAGIVFIGSSAITTWNARKAKKEAAKASAVGIETAESIGTKNGKGSLQAQASEFYDRFHAIESEISKLREHHLEEKAKHEEGSDRQVRIQDAILSLQNLIATTRDALSKVVERLDTTAKWQEDHTEEDFRTFTQLKDSVEHLNSILGETENIGDPLVPYVHALAHNINNKLTVSEMTASTALTTLEDAIKLLKEMRAEKEKDVHKEVSE